MLAFVRDLFMLRAREIRKDHSCPHGPRQSMAYCTLECEEGNLALNV